MNFGNVDERPISPVFFTFNSIQDVGQEGLYLLVPLNLFRVWGRRGCNPAYHFLPFNFYKPKFYKASEF